MTAGLNIKRNSRIFHIANECYIIYLGIRSDEERPFLRVGNIENIDERILDVISNTVVSSRFTGNPLYELKLDKKGEINYVGDTAVIERMKTYLNSFELPSDGAVDYHKIKDREQRDVVYFYNNGNIKLNYKEEAIFDLYKRSQADLHFVYQCDEIKKSFARNPLRYTKHDFRESGFLLAGKSTLLFSGGHFFSAALDREYFSSLAAAGVDPDQIGVHFTSIHGGDESDDASHSLIEMLKRSSYRNTPFVVLASNLEYAAKVCALFPGANVRGLNENWIAPFSGIKVRRSGENLEFQSRSFPVPLIVGNGKKGDGHITLDYHTKMLTVNRNGASDSIKVPQGIPCNIKDKPASMGEMTDIYISRFVPLIKGFSTEDDYKVSLAIQKLMKMLSSVVDGSAKSGLIMRSSVFNFTDLLKQVSLKTDSILTYFLENSLGLLGLALERSKDMEGKIVKNIHSLQSDIKGLLIKSVKADPLLPVAVDIYTESAPRLFYRSVKSTAKKADYVLAAQLASEILTDKDLAPRYYREEKDRLIKLIGMLESATDLEVDKILEEQKPAQPVRERGQEIIDERGVKADQLGETPVQPPAKSTSSTNKKWWLLFLIPLLGLILWGGIKGIPFLRDKDNQNILVSTSGSGSDGKKKGSTDSARDIATDESTSGSTNGTTDGTTNGTTTDNKVEKSGKNNNSELKLKDDATETENRVVAGQEKKVMETESRPANAEEVKAYLNVGDYHISLVDIHLVSNKIAVDNNYRDLDYKVYDGADPDWIYPGNEIILPDGTVHLVVRGDAIWYMAARYIRKTLDRDIPVYQENRAKAEEGDPQAVKVLTDLMKGSPCEAFREKIHEVLQN